MPDSVSCRRDVNGAFTCDVHIDSDFKTAEPNAAPAAPAAPTPQPPQPTSGHSGAVEVLVERFTVPRAAVSMLTASAALACSPTVASVALALVSKSPILGTLLGLKGGIDIGKCLAEQNNEARERATEPAVDAACHNRGGYVSGERGDVAICVVPNVTQAGNGSPANGPH